MKNLFILFAASVLSFYFLFVGASQNFKEELKQDSLKTVTISFVGDLMCHSPQINYACTGTDSFDFKPVFREVKKYLSNADITIGNLETVIAGKEYRYSGYPLFNTPKEYLAALKDSGFDVLITSNNHALDRGKKGILKTIEMIHEFGMSSIGTYNSQIDRDSVRVFEINGIKLALLAYTYGLNGNFISENEKYLVNVIDSSLIKRDIKASREKKADVVMIYFHFGEEYQREPNEFQKQIVEQAIDYGADLIIGSHPHVIQPLELYSSAKSKLRQVLVAYSLGNFLSNQRWRYSDAGVILNIEFTKGASKQEVELSNISFIPTWVFKGKTERGNEFVILPSDTSLDKSFKKYLSGTDLQKLIESYNDTELSFRQTYRNLKAQMEALKTE